VYLFKRWIEIFDWGPDGGVEAGALGEGNLILIPPTDFPMVFLALFWGVGLAVAFRLPARVFKVMALAPTEGSLIDSSPGVQAKTGMAWIGISLLKPGMGEMKLSIVCIQTKETYDFNKIRQVVLTRVPYQVSFHPNMVGVHLLIGRPTRGVLEHFF
jgi:hypothetical protein